MKKILTLLLTLTVFLVLSGCGNQEKQQAKNSKTTVSVAMLRLTSTAPLFIAMDEGYFAKENIEIKPEWFEAAHPIAVATASGKVDVGATGITASLYNMAAMGQKLAIVADKGREEKGYPSSALLVSKKAYESGIKTIKDLKGKRIGITSKGSTFTYMLGQMLEKSGVSLDEVTFIPLGKLSSVMATLKSGKIDACVLNEPNVTKVEKAGYGHMISPVSSVMRYQTSGIFFAPEFVKNEKVNQGFLRAYNKACKLYYAAVISKTNPENREKIVNTIAKYTKAPKEDIEKGLPYIDQNGQLMSKDIQTQIDWYKAHGMIEGNLKASDVINTSLLEKAIK